MTQDALVHCTAQIQQLSPCLNFETNWLSSTKSFFRARKHVFYGALEAHQTLGNAFCVDA